MKKIYPDKRSWWVKSDGTVLDAGYDHDEFVEENSQLFNGTTPSKREWARVGSWGHEFVVQADFLTVRQLDVIQKIYRETGKSTVYLFTTNKDGQMSGNEFLLASVFTDLLKNIRVGSRFRQATWQSQLSRQEVMRRFPDKRSWWIDSSGEVFDAGKDHDKFVKEHPELFDHEEGDSTYYAFQKFWVRVSLWGPSFTINSRDINQKQLDAAQILYMREGQGKKVEFFQDNVINTSFDGKEFISLGNVNQLKRMRPRLANGASDWMKKNHPDKRSWWVDPQGTVFDVGHDHNKFLEERPKTFGKHPDINKALTLDWVRVALWGGEYVVHGHSISSAQITTCQKIYRSLGGVSRIFISTLNKTGYISQEDFLTADRQIDLVKNLFSDPTGIRGSVALYEKV
jgi:hypothetical protein